MKIYYIAILIAIVITAKSQKCVAQWTTVYQDINAQFYDASFPTDNIGYVAAADSGGCLLLCTNDGGITWIKKYIFGWGYVDKIVMIDSLKGYLIKGGVPGKILKTNDGFNTYTVHNTDTSYIVQSISLLNDSTGFYLNNAGRLRKFQHFGSSITHIFDTLAAGQNLQFVNSYTGYLDTGNGLLVTTDAGNSWNYTNNNLPFFCVVFRFADSLNGYFSDFNKIYKTNDGGISFQQQYNFLNSYSLAVKGNFCMATNDLGDVAYTTDGGLSWQPETTGINFIVNEPYKVTNTPGGYCFLFSQFCGEIKKRQAPLIASISDPSGDNNISIYPNPFTSKTTISFAEQQQNTKIKITDILGKEISTTSFSGTQLSIDRREMNVGIYFITITGENKNILNKKIIVQ